MKSLFRTIFVLIIFTSVSFAGIPPQGVKINKDGNSYIIDFSIPESKTTSVTIENKIYTKIEIPEYGITSIVGQPMLPQISFFLMTGKNENTPVVKVLNQDRSPAVLKNSIYPVQPPREKVPNKVNPFVIDENYYKTTGSINEPFAVVSEPFIIGGAKGVMVTIFPYAYNPSTNELYTTFKGSFKIELNSVPVLDFSPRPAMDEFFSSAFVNYEMQNTKGTNNYLIITTPALESGLAPLVTHKQGLGYNVTVVNTTLTGTTNTAIKSYIQTLYNNISTRPEFILLVGDVPDIPNWIGGGTGTPNTDWNYALLEGSDLWVDAFLGRFSVTTLTQLSNIINKTIYMESSINNLWKKNVFMASTDNHTISEGSHNFVIDSFFIPNNFTVNTKLYSYYGATTQQVSQSLDSNKIFAIYSGHGAETYWADGPVFYQSNVNALNNTIFPFVYSFACVTGSYHIAECFAETWIRSPKAGVMIWASSVNSYWDEDDVLERRLGRAMFTDNLKRNAENFVKAKIYLVQHFGSMTGMMQRYIEMYNCLGDPSIYQLSYGPAISHTPLQNTENLAGPYTVNCTVAPAGSPIISTKLFWTRTTAFDSVAMTNSSGNNWTYNIPGNGQSAIYKYYIKTQDNAGLISILPIGAPANYFSFTASPDTVKPVITHSALANVPKVNWPVSVSAGATDNIGVDSVWVRWYKNNTGTGIKHFKLLPTGGNNYSAAFNSVNADVAVGDSIFYRVFARDNSAGHNTDSTALYQFKIINQVNVTIGNGTTAIGWPYYTFYMDSRTDMLYLGSEIGVPGPGAYITQIGFDVVSAASQVMNGFQIKMQNTTANSILAFTSTGWTTAYNGTYSVPGSGWQMVTLQTPFYYTGGSNLLIEICYNNSSYTSNTTVNGAAATGRNVHQHSDLSSGDGCTAITSPGSTYTTLPNLKLVMNPGPPLGITQKGNEIPAKYELAQNYPNPFNPTTKINFAIPKQGLVTLKVYDVLGREVANLVNEVKTAGNYIVDFDASYLASGVYFYKLEVNGFSDVKRLVLIK
jgi:hypothetical protein